MLMKERYIIWVECQVRDFLQVWYDRVFIIIAAVVININDRVYNKQLIIALAHIIDERWIFTENCAIYDRAVYK